MGKVFVGQLALVLVFVGCADGGGGSGAAPECNGLDVLFEGCALPEAQPLEPDPDWSPEPAENGGVWGNLPSLCDPSPAGAPCCGRVMPDLKCWDGVAVVRCGDGDWQMADGFNLALCDSPQQVYASCITDSWPSGQGFFIGPDRGVTVFWAGPGVLSGATCMPDDIYARSSWVMPWEDDGQSTPFGVVQDTRRIYDRECWDPFTGEEGDCL